MRARTITHYLIVGCVFLSVTATLRADTPDQARKVIEAAYAKQVAALNKKDLDGFVAPYTDAFLETDTKGQTKSKAQEREEAKLMFGMAQKLKVTMKVTKFSLKGDTATVEIAAHTDAVLSTPGAAKMVKMVDDETTRDTWTKTGKGWMIVSTKDLTGKTSLDGKTVDEVTAPSG